MKSNSNNNSYMRSNLKLDNTLKSNITNNNDNNIKSHRNNNIESFEKSSINPTRYKIPKKKS